MGIVIVAFVMAVVAGGIVRNHRQAARAIKGVSFVVPYSPAAVVAAIQRAHNEGAKAALRGVLTGVSVTGSGPTTFVTQSAMGDLGEIFVVQNASGSVITVHAVSLVVGAHPNVHRFGLAFLTHGVFRVLGLTPGSARLVRWQDGLGGRITRNIARVGPLMASAAPATSGL